MVNYSLIGCGRMGLFPNKKIIKYSPNCWKLLGHLESATYIPIFNINSLCDKIIREIPKKYKKYSFNFYQNFKELIYKEKIDILSIATRTDVKFEIMRLALEKGIKNFHIEKPLCNTTKELEFYTKNSNKLNITFGTLRRYFDIFIKAKKLVNSKKFGKIVHIDINYGFEKLFWSHPHSIDTILFFLNDIYPNRVICDFKNLNFKFSKNTLYLKNDPYVNFINFTFKNNITASINKVGNMDTIIHLEKARIEIPNDGSNLKVIKYINLKNNPYKKESKPIIYEFKDKHSGTYAAYKIHEAYFLKKENFPSNKHILYNQKIIFECLKSFLISNTQIKRNQIKEIKCNPLFKGKIA